MEHLRVAGWLSKEFADVILGEEADMTRCLDIHTHHAAPQAEAVVCATIMDFNPLVSQLYSLGYHPWDTEKEPSTVEWEHFESMAMDPHIVAIGECGIDLLRGGALYRQLLIMKKQIEISERLKKPLIIHDVKAHDIILGLKRDLKPQQKWLIHGFRGKPSLAAMLIKAGINLSFGEKFNPDTLKSVPLEMIFAETDESLLNIEAIIGRLSAVIGKNLTDQIASNTTWFLNL